MHEPEAHGTRGLPVGGNGGTLVGSIGLLSRRAQACLSIVSTLRAVVRDGQEELKEPSDLPIASCCETKQIGGGVGLFAAASASPSTALQVTGSPQSRSLGKDGKG